MQDQQLLLTIGIVLLQVQFSVQNAFECTEHCDFNMHYRPQTSCLCISCNQPAGFCLSGGSIEKYWQKFCQDLRENGHCLDLFQSPTPPPEKKKESLVPTINPTAMDIQQKLNENIHAQDTLPSLDLTSLSHLKSLIKKSNVTNAPVQVQPQKSSSWLISAPELQLLFVLAAASVLAIVAYGSYWYAKNRTQSPHVSAPANDEVDIELATQQNNEDNSDSREQSESALLDPGHESSEYEGTFEAAPGTSDPHIEYEGPRSPTPFLDTITFEQEGIIILRDSRAHSSSINAADQATLNSTASINVDTESQDPMSDISGATGYNLPVVTNVAVRASLNSMDGGTADVEQQRLVKAEQTSLPFKPKEPPQIPEILENA